MTATPRAVIYVSAAAGVAVVRGRTAADDITRLTGCRPKWSTSREGWLMDARWVGDYEALAKTEHEFVTVSQRPPKPRVRRA